MRNKLILLAFTLISLFACSKHKSPERNDDFNNLPKMKSFFTPGLISNYNFSYCSSTNPYIPFPSYTFHYDNDGNISKITRDMISLITDYVFTYAADGKVAKIISTLGDSIIINHPTLIRNDILYYSNSRLDHEIHETDTPSQIDFLLIKIDPYGNGNDTLLKASFQRNSDQNITTATYFYGSSQTIHYSFIPTIINPHYRLYKKLQLPFYLISQFTNSTGDLWIIDMGQSISKNCVKSTDYFNNESCIPQTTYQKIYPDSIFITSNDKLTRINPTTMLYRSVTGAINASSFFSY